MATNFKKKLFLLVFCLASITQGMYSTYFVSILNIIERIYQIQSKTAGAIISATEIGQILGSLFIAYYGGRGNKSKWMSVCMTLSAIAALISISPHFILLATNNNNLSASREQAPPANNINSSMLSITPSPYLTSDLSIVPKLHETRLTTAQLRDDLPDLDQLCRYENHTQITASSNTTYDTHIGKIVLAQARLDEGGRERSLPISVVIAIFSICLLAIGFGSTAITTLGIPFIDDIISKEESPLYLGLTIGLRIFGPALGFVLGSFCISLDSSSVLSSKQTTSDGHSALAASDRVELGAWWLGLILISLPQLVLAIPMYFLSKSITISAGEKDDYEDITYQAAEDHDIGGSHDFPAHIMGLAGDLDITSNQTCFSSGLDSSSREVLQICSSSQLHYDQTNNFKQNIAYDQPILSMDCMTRSKTNLDEAEDTIDRCDSALRQATSTEKPDEQWRMPNVCLVVNYLGALESSGFPRDASSRNQPAQMPTARSSPSSSVSHAEGDRRLRKKQSPDKSAITDLSSSLSRLLQNKLLVLRMLSGVLHILPIAGFYTFLPKYLIEQFRVTSSGASVISGLAGILFVGFGAFIGGTIIRLFNVNSRMMTRWIAASALLYAVGMIILMDLSCDQRLVHFDSQEYVSTDCSASCYCARDNFNPVCANGTTYVTPCLAGCKGSKITGGMVIYDECGCSNVAAAGANATIKPDLIHVAGPHINLNVAIGGKCSASCDSITWYVILFSIFTLIHSSCEVGSMMFNLRCVKSGDRTLALGLITFSSSLLGTIPCSILYGSIVDFSCVHWDRYTAGDMSPDSSHHGACRAYDNDLFRYYLHGLTALAMSLAFIIDCIISTRSSEVDFYGCQDDSKMDIRVGLKKSTETI